MPYAKTAPQFLCGSWGHKNRHGQPCQKRCVRGARACPRHGGRPGKGIAAPNFKSGLYSAYMPTALVAKYEEMGGRPEIAKVDEILRLLATRTAELLEELKALENAGESISLLEAFEALQGEIADGRSAEELEPALERMLTAIQSLKRKDNVWRQLQQLTEQQRRAIETKNDLESAMTPDDVQAIAGQLALAVRSHVRDPLTLRAIQSDFSAALARIGLGPQPAALPVEYNAVTATVVEGGNGNGQFH